MMRLAAIVLLVSIGCAQAHDTGIPHAEAGWTLAPSIVVPLGLSLALYALGGARLWGRAGFGHGLWPTHTLAFAAGWLALAAALVSPMHELGERSFAVHMIEHEVLMTVAAPLLVLSRPVVAFLWAVPRVLRVRLGGLGHAAWTAPWRFFLRPLPATILHGIAIWVWHVPVFFHAAVENEGLHWLQHASFLGTALIFWWAMVKSSRGEFGYGAAVADLFVTATHTGLLGALLLVSPRLWYETPLGAPLLWRLTPLEDQQLAGLLMWIPGGIVYVGAALIFAGLWIAQSGRRSMAASQPSPAG